MVMSEDKKPILNEEELKRFMSLFIPAQRKVYAYIAYHVPNKNDSDDVFQEIVAILLGKFNDYQEGTDFLRWAIAVAKYKILSFRRDNNRRKVIFDEIDMDKVQGEILKKIEMLDDESKALKQCLKKLSPNQQKLVKHRYYYEMTYRQIAHQFNISMQSTYRAISRIHAVLLKCIQISIQQGGSYG
jgi:RNA polymerase sigma-70 factor (ECF subfamily)